MQIKDLIAKGNVYTEQEFQLKGGNRMYADENGNLVFVSPNGYCFGENKVDIETLTEDLNADNAGAHNSIYRGKLLGNQVTEEQYSEISNGTFRGMYIGDYWIINGVTYRIAAFDYYFHTGDTNFEKHHVVIVPDTYLYSYVMNDTATTAGGYVGSKMYTEGLNEAKSIIRNAFPAHVLTHRILLTNSVSSGRPSNIAWCDSEVDLMCETMVYGSGIFASVSDGTNIPSNYKIEKSQLPLFLLNPSKICGMFTWWLRDVVTSARFSFVGYHGQAHNDNANSTYGVRPFFCIG